jgi:hypothetical protein
MGAAARIPAVAGTGGADLSDLFAAAHALDRADAVAVRITALEEDGPTDESAGPIGLPAGKYDLLGYDVADYYLLGGLTNCGYKPRRRRRSRRPGRLSSTSGTCSTIPRMLRRSQLSRNNECPNTRHSTSTVSISWADHYRRAGWRYRRVAGR